MTLPLPESPRRLVYAGTPELATTPLASLVAAGFEVALVATRPDARRGRGGEPQPSPVKAEAVRLGIPVTHDPAELIGVGADLGVVVAYGRLIRSEVLAVLPMINLHFSLLPRWRGAAPVERALLAGDAVTGVCVMDVVDELDAGGVFARAEVMITPTSTLESLRHELVEVGTGLLIDGLRSGFGPPEPQRGETLYAHKIGVAELEIDWAGPVEKIDRVIRVGGAWTTFRGRRLKIISAHPTPPDEPPNGGDPGTIRVGSGTHRPVVATGAGSLVLTEVHAEGKARVDAASWLNGARPGSAERLGT